MVTVGRNHAHCEPSRYLFNVIRVRKGNYDEQATWLYGDSGWQELTDDILMLALHVGLTPEDLVTRRKRRREDGP